MTSVGPNGTGTGTNDASAGTQVWSNPGNITASDNTYAQSTAGSPGQTSQILKATNFGFSIPAGATINGVVDEIQRKGASATSVKDAVVKLIISGTISGNNRADTVTNWPTTEAYATYGSSTDTAGLTITAAQINDATSGVAIQATFSVAFTSAYVDYVRRTVYYTVFTTSSRAVSSTTGLKATQSRTVSSTAGFKATQSRSVHGTTALKATVARMLSSTSLLTSRLARTVSSASLFKVALVRSIHSTTGFRASLSRTVTSTTLFAYHELTPLLAPTINGGITSASVAGAADVVLTSDGATFAGGTGAVHAVIIGTGTTKARLS